ncbi:MAG: TetR/AcrR family transcriptional regulator [Solirubrobacterales bacterium]|nr:TetR/AcrR family transcriptional regulator [Solirubrobacterales bacterium]MBV9164907.1 TetR/AcrR family transcriptional regulator [Solirubrobacterales bacterium]
MVDAALREFSDHGYEGASLGRIAADAGVTRTVLYDHFSSKRALFVALLEAEHRRLLSHLRAALAGDAPSAERIRAMLEAFLAFAEYEPEAWRLLYPEHAPVEPEVAGDHRRLHRDASRLLASMLAPDARRAGLDPASPVAGAILALQQAALEGLVRWWHVHPRVSRDEVLDAAMKALWNGLEGLEKRGAR